MVMPDLDGWRDVPKSLAASLERLQLDYVDMIAILQYMYQEFERVTILRPEANPEDIRPLTPTPTATPPPQHAQRRCPPSDAEAREGGGRKKMAIGPPFAASPPVSRGQATATQHRNQRPPAGELHHIRGKSIGLDIHVDKNGSIDEMGRGASSKVDKGKGKLTAADFEVVQERLKNWRPRAGDREEDEEDVGKGEACWGSHHGQDYAPVAKDE
ncbi:hypothetical protein QBC39DRAFT_334166 [Podospora conica]|nr:hypothetical protein QBC39DRAFT_334166 [Schizothecium conicum]